MENSTNTIHVYRCDSVFETKKTKRHRGNKTNQYIQAKIFQKYGFKAILEQREKTCLKCAFCGMQKAIPYWCWYGLLPISLDGRTCTYFKVRTSAGQT